MLLLLILLHIQLTFAFALKCAIGQTSTDIQNVTINNLKYRECSDKTNQEDGCSICCSYSYNTSEGNRCVGFTSNSIKNCVEETPVSDHFLFDVYSCNPSNKKCTACDRIEPLLDINIGFRCQLDWIGIIILTSVITLM